MHARCSAVRTKVGIPQDSSPDRPIALDTRVLLIERLISSYQSGGHSPANAPAGAQQQSRHAEVLCVLRPAAVNATRTDPSFISVHHITGLMNAQLAHWASEPSLQVVPFLLVASDVVKKQISRNGAHTWKAVDEFHFRDKFRPRLRGSDPARLIQAVVMRSGCPIDEEPPSSRWVVIEEAPSKRDDSSTQVRQRLRAADWDGVARACMEPMAVMLRELCNSSQLYIVDEPLMVASYEGGSDDSTSSQSRGTTMRAVWDRSVDCEGDPAGTGSIVLLFDFPAAKGCKAQAKLFYLPASRQGHAILAVLRAVFTRGFLFSVATDSATRRLSINTRDIPLKAARGGGEDENGYPEEGYMTKLLKSLLGTLEAATQSPAERAAAEEASSEEARAVHTRGGQPAHYLGIFLDDASRSALHAACGPRHPNEFYHHMALLYWPTQTEVDEIYERVGKGATIEMTARLVAEDSAGQALLVTPVGPIARFVRSDVPHVLLSCADGVTAVYSNALLQTAVSEPDKVAGLIRFDDGSRAPLTLRGVLGTSPQKALPSDRSRDRWAFAPLELGALASEIQALVSDEWLWHGDDGRGGKLPTAPMAIGASRSQGLHCSVLLGIDVVGARERLRSAAACAPLPAEVGVQDVFVSKVDRLAEHDVWCIGVSFVSPCIRAIREAWLESVPAEQHISHVPYPGEGHASLAFFAGKHRAQVEAAVSAKRSGLLGSSVPVPCVVYQDRLTKQFEAMPIGPAAMRP